MFSLQIKNSLSVDSLKQEFLIFTDKKVLLPN